MTVDTDLLGRKLDTTETEVLDLYRRAKALAGRADVPPCVRANARVAVVGLWNIVNDLALDHEQLTDLDA